MNRYHKPGFLLSCILPLLALGAAPGEELPQYGGQLNVATQFLTLSAQSWDPVDWSWKQNHDSGAVREQLFAADLQQGARNGSHHNFAGGSYIPPQLLRGELAESWSWEDEPGDRSTLVVELRKGIIWPGREGIMAARELDASDVVFSFYQVYNSPRKTATFLDHIERVEARDRHTVEFHFKYFNAEWAYRYGHGPYSAIVPRETAAVDRGDWHNVIGTGPFSLDNYVPGNLHNYRKNRDYWATEFIAGEYHSLPFIDELQYRVIKDQATALAALRTAQIDIHESVSWMMVEHLKHSTPQLQWSRRLQGASYSLSLRVDQKPFDDLRVRRAMNLAVDQEEIAKRFYGGHAKLLAFPQHPRHGPYYQPLEDMPDSVQELFRYDPEKARALLAEAGYPEGFSFKTQVCVCVPTITDLVQLVSYYLKKVGIQMDIEVLEYGAFLSLRTTGNHAPGTLSAAPVISPTSALRVNFGTGQFFNASQYSDPEFDRRIELAYRTRDEDERQRLVQRLTVEILEQAPHLFMPTQYLYSAWWPWVKNYGGELEAGTARPGPIYARLWIDQKMKHDMGF